MAFVTSVRGIEVLPPQILDKAGESFFGAKMPLPAFFISAARAAPAADAAALFLP